MSDLVVPGLVAVAAIALTYLFCIRPMRNGHCAMKPISAERDGGRGQDEEEVARLRRDVDQLRAELGERDEPKQRGRSA